MNIIGKIIEVLPEQSGTSARGEWLKRGFILETTDQYPKKVAIDVFKQDVQFVMGQSVNVSVNVESREFNSKWYTNITAWKIEAGTPSTSVPTAPSVEDNDPNGDLPF